MRKCRELFLELNFIISSISAPPNQQRATRMEPDRDHGMLPYRARQDCYSELFCKQSEEWDMICTCANIKYTVLV